MKPQSQGDYAMQMTPIATATAYSESTSGQEYDFTQIEFFITPKGMARLTKEFNGDAA